jgi:hypothetical protein
MNSYTHVTARLIVLFWLLILFPGSAGAQDVTISIHLRGVFDSKISLLPLSGANALKPIVVVDDVKEGETITLQVSPDNLPGEFVLQFDYREAARLYLVKEAFTWEI